MPKQMLSLPKNHDRRKKLYFYAPETRTRKMLSQKSKSFQIIANYPNWHYYWTKRTNLWRSETNALKSVFHEWTRTKNTKAEQEIRLERQFKQMRQQAEC